MMSKPIRLTQGELVVDIHQEEFNLLERSFQLLKDLKEAGQHEAAEHQEDLIKSFLSVANLFEVYRSI